MPNLYGVATPNPVPIQGTTTGSAPVTCNAGVETNIISLSPPLPTVGGVYYPVMWGSITIVFGASLPGLVTIAARINSGADILAFVVHGGFYVASASFCQPFYLPCISQVVQNPSGVWNFQISVNPTTNGVTVQPNSTQTLFQWVRAPDQ